MIPIRLTLQGIYSYQDTPQAIEFGPLMDAGLFGIFGAVGSGKSSILESISMAVYGEIERLNKRDDRNYNMMNLKANRLYIDFEFGNYTGQRFRFECEGRRNSNQYNDVSTYRRKASEWIDDKWVPLDHTNGELVTGLSYENFKRTVIIPQGKFQEFLGLTPGDRSRMLLDLFNLDRFDLTSATSKLISKNSDDIHHLEGRLTGYEEVTSEWLKNANENVLLLMELVEKKSSENDDLQKQISASTELKKLYDQVAEFRTLYLSMKEAEPDLRLVEWQLKKYQEAREQFFSLIGQVTAMDESVSELEKSLQTMAEQEKVLREVKEERVEKYQRLQKLVDSHGVQQRNATEALVASKLRTVLDMLRQKEERVENGLNSVLELQGLIAEKEKEVEILSEKLASNRVKLQSRELMLEVRNAFVRKEELIGQIKKYNTKIEEAKGVVNEKKNLFFRQYPFIDATLEVSQIINILHSRISKCFSEKSTLEKKWHQLKVQSEMAGYVEQLTPGEPCPLCGSTQHPAPTHFTEVAQEIRETGDQITSLENEQKKLEKAKVEWDHLLDDENRMLQNQEQDKTDVDNIRKSVKKLDDFLNSYSDVYSDRDQVDQLLEVSTQLRDSLKLIEEQEKKIREDIRNKYIDLEKYREKINQFRSECDQMKGEVSSMKTNLSESVLNQLYDQTSEGWKALSEQLNLEIEQEKNEYQKVSSERDKIVQEYAELDASSKMTKAYLEKEKLNFERLRSQLDSALATSSFETLEEVENVLKKDMDTEVERKKIGEFEKNLHVIEERLSDLEKQIGNRLFDIDEHENLLKEGESAEKELLNLREQKNYLTKKLEESQKRWEEKKNLTENLKKLQLRAENLKVLEGLFRGKGFVDYVSTIYLREICEIANRRFRKLTNNHFALVLNVKNEFEVRDYLNDGQRRSVKTLSGGQTFQVSLCLALALAESLQNQSHSSQNFFFLDEGFGTLDGEALRLVFESLKSLRHEGRVVGIISHVESLQDEMDMYLHIHNDSEKGSQIRKSWEV